MGGPGLELPLAPVAIAMVSPTGWIAIQTVGEKAHGDMPSAAFPSLCVNEVARGT